MGAALPAGQVPAPFLRKLNSRELSPILQGYGELQDQVRAGLVDSQIVQRLEAFLLETYLDFLLQKKSTGHEQIHDGIGRISKIVCSMKEFAPVPIRSMLVTHGILGSSSIRLFTSRCRGTRHPLHALIRHVPSQNC